MVAGKPKSSGRVFAGSDAAEARAAIARGHEQKAAERKAAVERAMLIAAEMDLVARERLRAITNERREARRRAMAAAEAKAAKQMAIEASRQAAVTKALEDAAALRQLERHDEAESWWTRFMGHTLEDSLTTDSIHGQAPVRLVDARFLIALAANEQMLPRRQDCPERAFIGLPELKRMTGSPAQGLRILVVSHPWLEPTRPDPKGSNLRRLATALRSLVEETVFTPPSTYAVFIDYCSVHQPHPDRFLAGRSGAEAELYARAIESMGEWYSHPYTTVIKMTAMPPGYREGFQIHVVHGVEHAGQVFPINDADYDGRAWCNLENAVANLNKISKLMVLDLATTCRANASDRELLQACTAQQRVPLTPEAFVRSLAEKKLAVRADYDIIVAQYQYAFGARLGNAEDLDWRDREWGKRGKQDCELLCELFASGRLTKCWRIDLRGNHFRPREISQVEEAIKTGMAQGTGFNPTDVRLGSQHGRPEVRNCTPMEIMKLFDGTLLALPSNKPQSGAAGGGHKASYRPK